MLKFADVNSRHAPKTCQCPEGGSVVVHPTTDCAKGMMTATIGILHADSKLPFETLAQSYRQAWKLGGVARLPR